MERCFSFVRAVSQRCDDLAFGMTPSISPTQMYRADAAVFSIVGDGNRSGGACSSCANDDQLGGVPCATALDPVEAPSTPVLLGSDLCGGARDVGSPMWCCMGADDGQGVERE